MSEFDYSKLIISLNVEAITGRTIHVKASLNDTIHQIKAKIFRSEGIAISQQKLIWQSTELDDNLTIRDYEIHDGATIKMVVPLRGGPINSRRMTNDELLWRDFSELIDSELLESYPINNKHVTLLLYRDGDNLNLLRVIDRNEGSPLSGAMSAASMYGAYEEVDKEIDEERLAENKAMKGKMQMLKAQMNKMHVSKPNTYISTIDTNNNNKNSNLSKVDEKCNENEIKSDNVEMSNAKTTPVNPHPPQEKLSKSSSLNSLRMKRFHSLTSSQLISASSSNRVEESDEKTTDNDDTDKNGNEYATTDTTSYSTKPNNKNLSCKLIANIDQCDLEKLDFFKNLDLDSKHILSVNYVTSNLLDSELCQATNYIDDDMYDEDNEEDDDDDGDDVDDDDPVDNTKSELLKKSVLINNSKYNSNFCDDCLLNEDEQLKDKVLILNFDKECVELNHNEFIVANGADEILETKKNEQSDDKQVIDSEKQISEPMNPESTEGSPLKCISSAESLVSRNHASSKMLQSVISINNQSVEDNISPTLMLSQQNDVEFVISNERDSKMTSYENTTDLPSNVNCNRNNVNCDEVYLNNKQNVYEESERKNSVTFSSELSSSAYNHKTSLKNSYPYDIDSQKTTAAAATAATTAKQLVHQHQHFMYTPIRKNSKMEPLYINPAKRLLSPKLSSLYAKKESDEAAATSASTNQHLQNIAYNETTSISLLPSASTTNTTTNTNPILKNKQQYQLISSISSSLPGENKSCTQKVPPSLHHPLNPMNSYSQINPLILSRNTQPSSFNSSVTTLTPSSSNLNASRLEILMKNANTKQATKDERVLASPSDRLLYSAKLKKLNQSLNREGTPKLPPVKTKNDSTRYCFECRKKTGLATSYTCRCGNNYCTSHRNAEAHNCSYDYKTEGRRLIEINNPLVAAPKLPKI